MKQISIQRLSNEAVLPTRAYADDAGLDLYTLEDVHLPAGEGRVASTGIAVALERGFVGLIMDRSSMAKKGIKTAGGVIDAGYRGEIKIVLWNLSSNALRLVKGEKIAQLLIHPIATPAVLEVQELQQAQRGDRGFGSSGQ